MFESECAGAGRQRAFACAGMSPSLQHGMPFCISYCRKEAKASTWKYADGHKKKPPRPSSRGGTFTAYSQGLPRSQRTVSREGEA